jgi:hypothetical protein
MNPDERLPDAVHGVFDTARPAPDLEDRIVERASAAGRRPIRTSLQFGLAGVAALVLVAALIPFVLNSWPHSASSTAAPAGALAHFDRDGLAFDYPASWTASVSGQNMHYVTILDYLGTGSGLAKCTDITPGPGDQFLGGTECGSDLTVGAGEVVVELSRQDGPPRGPIDPTDPTALSSGDKYVTVAGLPAISRLGGPRTADADLVLDWDLSVPGQLMSQYMVHAEIKNPGADQMRTQVEALVASIRYSPPVAVLNPADGPRIAAIGMAQVRTFDVAYGCFPNVPGATATAIVTQFPGYSALSKALPVTCSIAIEPYILGLWKMTLTESWTVASDRSAGSLTTTIWLAPDGTPGETDGGTHSVIPYWP